VTLGAHFGRLGAEFEADRLLGGFAGGFAGFTGFALAEQFDIVIVLSHFDYKKDYFFFIFFRYFHLFLKMIPLLKKICAKMFHDKNFTFLTPL
jgi:hypothetical protein